MKDACVGAIIGLMICQLAQATERMSLWPAGRIPDFQTHQVGATTEVLWSKGFKASEHRMPYLEWFDPPEARKRNGGCMILISGGGYVYCSDMALVRVLAGHFTQLGYQCASLTYRTPRPKGLPYYQSAWEDGQRAVRLVRSEAKKRGYDPERIGVAGMSAGAHLTMLLALNSQTRSYARVDEIDDYACHVNWAFPWATPYVLTDGPGCENARGGDAIDVHLDPVLKFDAKSCPMCLFHGGEDLYSPIGTTRVYRELRKRKIPAEVHIYPERGHLFWGDRRKGSGSDKCWARMNEFLRQLNFDGELGRETPLSERLLLDSDRASCCGETLWPAGKMPDSQPHLGTPAIEWSLPKTLKTSAVQIVCAGNASATNATDRMIATKARRYFNSRGMAVVTLLYRSPTPRNGLARYTVAWQDLQRAVRVVRSKAKEHSLDPGRIGVFGVATGGHLALLGALSSLQRTYNPVDDIDKLPCNVQWSVAYSPSDVLAGDGNNDAVADCNDPSLRPTAELNFDLKSCPVLFVHGDADSHAATGSVKCWEQLRKIGLQGELHTLALRKGDFMMSAAPNTGSWSWLDRAWEFFVHYDIDRDRVDL